VVSSVSRAVTEGGTAPSNDAGLADGATNPDLGVATSLRNVLLDPEQSVALDVRGTTQAAVLVPLFMRGGELHAVFTLRRSDLRRHPGEISFPGGRREPGDPDLRATALREAHEEIGLAADTVEVIGALQPTSTFVTSYAIYPFVGLVSPESPWTPQATEVAEVIELPLPALTAGYGRRRITRRGMAIRTDTYVVGDHLIWGATARVLTDLMDRVNLL
jgi:8-oxo-dGTP pyrophosphatase MutT (NUDIX family)